MTTTVLTNRIIGVLLLLTLVLVLLKYTHRIHWSWWWVWSPLWLTWVLATGIGLGIVWYRRQQGKPLC